MTESPEVLTLKPQCDRRLRSGHVWIYSNEVDTRKVSLKQFTAGQQVRVENAKGKVIGSAYINPHTLICGRLFSTSPDQKLDRAFLKHRITQALGLRERFFTDQSYRLAYGDSDGLPGLVVDRFGDILVAQLGTAGMEAIKSDVIAALDEVLSPKGILLRNDSRNRSMEQLPEYTEVALGSVPETAELIENGVRFLAPVQYGQKTGWFYDHRDNRAWLKTVSPGKRVLDVFSYIGGWGVQAAAAGAESVLCVDSSETALDHVRENASLNGLENRVSVQKSNAFDALKSLCNSSEKFDVVVVDPPAFIPRHKDIDEGGKAYRRINELALGVLARDGILVSASCSLHLERERLRQILQGSARAQERSLQIIGQGAQGADHPIHPAIPETEYLKAYYCLVR